MGTPEHSLSFFSGLCFSTSRAVGSPLHCSKFRVSSPAEQTAIPSARRLSPNSNILLWATKHCSRRDPDSKQSGLVGQRQIPSVLALPPGRTDTTISGQDKNASPYTTHASAKKHSAHFCVNLYSVTLTCHALKFPKRKRTSPVWQSLG